MNRSSAMQINCGQLKKKYKKKKISADGKCTECKIGRAELEHNMRLLNDALLWAAAAQVS